MYPRSFLLEGATVERYTSSKSELCEIGEEAIWQSRFTCFFALHLFNSFSKDKEKTQSKLQNFKLQRWALVDAPSISVMALESSRTNDVVHLQKVQSFERKKERATVAK